MYTNVEHAFGGAQRMLFIIESIYAAVGSPQQWDSALRQVADALGGDSIALFAPAPDKRSADLLSISEMDPNAWQQFAQHFAAINPIMQRCEAQLDPESTWFSNAVLTDTELERTEFYTAFFRPNAMHHSVGMRLQASGLPVANISCQRQKSPGEFDGNASVILQTLRPHFVRALTLHMHLGGMQAQTAGLDAALNAHHHAVIGIDLYGRIAFCSTLAQSILEADGPLSAQGGRLAAKSYADNQTLQHLVSSAIGLRPDVHASRRGNEHSVVSGRRHPRPNKKSSAMGIPSDSMVLHGGVGRDMRLTVLPYRSEVANRTPGLAALAFLAISDDEGGSRAAALAGLYGLTPTEVRVADLLVAGRTLPEMSEQMKLSSDSLRFYLKCLFAKTGTHRQIDLLRLLLATPATPCR